MREQSKIPVSKVERAMTFAKTGAKVGRNYIKHYGKKVLNPGMDREELDQNNADNIYESLSELKGSALKMAQMIAMDKNALPTAYIDKFAMAQYSAPPLSYPLVVKTFKDAFGKPPTELFDTFTLQAVNAASIGQVHRATLNGKKMAVKVQYPGVGASVRSDLKIAKPFALRLMNIKGKDLDHYIEEVEERLLEETDYRLELERSIELSAACSDFEQLVFPKYYKDFSSDRVLTMDWLDGQHLDEFLRSSPSQETRDRIGQALWDFYNFQIHHLHKSHADPHPGNFLLLADGRLGVLDFGCVKEIPQDFYDLYFQLIDADLVGDSKRLGQLFYDLNFILPEDTPEQQKFFLDFFEQMIHLLGKPFYQSQFDFSNDAYFEGLYRWGEKASKSKQIRSANAARGSRHGIYIHRTYFGLYNLLNRLGATVTTRTVFA